MRIKGRIISYEIKTDEGWETISYLDKKNDYIEDNDPLVLIERPNPDGTITECKVHKSQLPCFYYDVEKGMMIKIEPKIIN